MNKLVAILMTTVFAVATTVSVAHEASTVAAKTVKVEKHTKKRVAKAQKNASEVAQKAQCKKGKKKVEKEASEVAQKAQCKKGHKHKHKEEINASDVAHAE